MYQSGQLSSDPPLALYHTTAAPGSALKLDVMRHRVERGEAATHPRDARVVYALPTFSRSAVVAMSDVMAAVADREELEC